METEELRIHSGELSNPIEVLEKYFCQAGVSLIQAAFAHSYFIHPKAVQARTPYFPDRARRSREHYPRLEKGQIAVWAGDGREVKLDDNQRAQMAWRKYTGHRLARRTGYSVRHVWGHPWNPDAFTAGWNLCYMPFWAGMLTEQQHPHPELERAIRQASWDLYFRDSPVCQSPEFVTDPGLDLTSLLDGQPILILGQITSSCTKRTETAKFISLDTLLGEVERMKAIRIQRHQSWSNIRKALRSLQGLAHEPFGTPNVERSAKSCVRKMRDEIALTFVEIDALLDEQAWGNPHRNPLDQPFD